MDRLGHASLLCTLLLSALRVCSGTVKVEVTPIIEVLKGETALLPCKFTVTPPSSNSVVEWYIDGVDNNRKRVAFRAQDGSSATIDKDSPMFERVTMGDDFSLSIASAMPTDERNFYCGVNALVSGTGEDTTMLKVFYAPEAPVLTKAASQAITADAADSSEIGECVTKNGLPQPRIIWFKDDKPLPEVKDSKEKTYMIPGVTKEASGMYTIKSKLYMQPTKADKDSVFHCMVEFSMPGKVMDKKKSNTITISLTYPSETATFTLVNTGPIKEGDTVTMKCETDGNPQPEFEFTKDGKTPVLGEGGLLVLKSVKRTDVGVYKCEATDFDNIDADLTGEINLSKISFIDPVTVTPAGPLSAKLGDMVEMQCTTKASEAPTVQWKKASKVIAGSSKGTLSLKSVTYDDAGEYECVGEVTTVPGLTAMASVNLTVIGKPMIDTPVNGEVMKEGDAVTLKCSAHGNPAPQFTWKPSGKESVEVQGNMVVSTVTLDASADVMASGVICETTNEHGTDSKTFTVAIKQVVEPRSGDNIENVAGQTGSGSSGVVIAVVVCVLLLLLLVALIYFLNKKGKLPCSKKDKKDMATGEVNNHGDIVVEMKTENPNEEAGLLKRPVNEQ